MIGRAGSSRTASGRAALGRARSGRVALARAGSERAALGQAASGRAALGRAKPTTRQFTPKPDWETIGRNVVESLEPVFGWVTRRIVYSRSIRELKRELYPILWHQWQTANDERTCPECGAMQGRSWREDQAMPAPPLHVNCRCQVVYAGVEWRVRYVPTWQLRWFTRKEWEWTRTGWA